MVLLDLLLKPFAYASLPALALHYAAQKSPIARYYVRLGLYLSTMGVCSIWGVIVSIGMALIGEKYNANFVTARSFYYLAGSLLDIHFEVEGEEYLENRPAVLVGNHQSMLDILYLGRIFPKRASIMAKKELQWMPLLGQYMTFSGAVFVDRGNNARAVQSLRAAGETIKAQSTSLWMFPEGTRSLKPVPDLLPFKKGAFHLAVQSGIPIIPVVCENYWRIYHQGVFEPGVLKIKVLPPISTTDLTTDDIGELAARVREQMISTLRSISSTPEQPVSILAPAAPRAQSPPRSPSPQDEPKTVIDERVPVDPRDKEKTPGPRERDISHESLYSSSASEARLTQASEAETEEDEGMILVGRPGKS